MMSSQILRNNQFNIIKKYYNIFIFIIVAILIEYFSFNFAKNYYDGFHLGLILNSSVDIDNGKLLYRDFYYPYGFFSLYLNNFFLNIFDNQILQLFVVYTQIYILGIFILFKIVEEIISKKYSCFIPFFFLAVHPFIYKPWHNYLIFLLVSFYFFLKIKNKTNLNLLSTFLLGISFLISEPFLLTSIIIFLFDLLFFRKYHKKLFFVQIIIFLIPFFTFYLFLYKSNLILDWQAVNNIFPELLNNFYKKNIFEYILQTIYTFFFSWKKILSNTFLIFYFIIFLFNIYFVLRYLIKKVFFNQNFKYDLFFFISVCNLLLISQFLNNISIFKLATLSTFGFIVLFNEIKECKDYFYKNFFLILIFVFCSMIAVTNIQKYISNNTKISPETVKNEKILFLQNKILEKKDYNALLLLDDTIKKIKINCKIKYFSNLTNNGYFYFIANRHLNSAQFLYWFKYNNGNWQNKFFLTLEKNLDKNFLQRIKNLYLQNNLLVISDISSIYLNLLLKKKDTYTKKFFKTSNSLSNKVLIFPKNCKID